MKRRVIGTLWMVGLTSLLLQGEDTMFTSEHFMGSDSCSRCHNGLSDEAGNDVSIESAWDSTMMANASKDPLWQAKVRSEIDRNPHLESVIADKCTACHAPMAHTEAHYSGDVVGVFGDGFLDASNPHHDEAMNGVSCTLCHQIKDNGKLGSLEGMSGKYEIDESRTIYGPYSDVFPGPMINNLDYTIAYSDHIRQSKMCASCHNLKTPYVDENGNVLSTTPESEFPEQMPYSEWEHSSYADTKSCQACHMKRSNGVVMASRPPWLSTQRDGFAGHMIVGGNKTMLDILNANRSALGVNGSHFDAVLAETDSMLRSSGSIDIIGSGMENGVLELTMQVSSATGHKLPTSFPARRAFLHVTVYDASGSVVFESGRANTDGSIAGADSDTDAAAFEPHHDLITSEDQVQIYESVMGDNLGAVTHTLLRGMRYLKDNRILPKGFDKTTAPDDIAVRGNAIDDDNFVGGSDRVTYRIDGLSAGTYDVTAELLYQSIKYPFAQDLFADTSAEVAVFQSMFDASSMKTSQIAAVSLTVSGSGGTTPPTAACGDGLDNDSDGLTDLDDPGCSDAADDDETDLPVSQPVTRFTDGFENGLDLWSIAGSGRVWQVSTQDPYEGSYSAFVNRTRNGRPTTMETTIDVSGYTTASLTYSRRLKGLDAGDDFGAAYFDGSWHDLERLGSGSENGGYLTKTFTIPVTATKIRFLCETSGKGEKCYVDDVRVIAQ